MPPRQVTRGRVEEPSYVRSVFGALISADNRSVVTAVGLFAVSTLHLYRSSSIFHQLLRALPLQRINRDMICEYL